MLLHRGGGPGPGLVNQLAKPNTLPTTKITLAMIDGPELTANRTRDTFITESDGMPVSARTTGTLWETMTAMLSWEDSP